MAIGKDASVAFIVISDSSDSETKKWRGGGRDGRMEVAKFVH